MKRNGEEKERKVERQGQEERETGRDTKETGGSRINGQNHEHEQEETLRRKGTWRDGDRYRKINRERYWMRNGVKQEKEWTETRRETG